MTTTLGWARVFPAIKRPPSDPIARLGVWYPVVSRGERRVVLEVNGSHVDLPDDLVELRDKRPEKFTVVYRTEADPNPAHGTRADLGRVYAVCPSCAARVKLRGHPEDLECTMCAHRGVVAWWETG